MNSLRVVANISAHAARPGGIGRAQATLRKCQSQSAQSVLHQGSFRALAQVQSDRDFPDIETNFNSARRPGRLPSSGLSDPKSDNDHRPPDERTFKLGKTLRILQTRLPSLLASPLPPEILSPHISLHLFPTTHPHLPTASGRVAYHAALWTAPMAWGRVPIVGNVELDILSERVLPTISGPSLSHKPVQSGSGSRSQGNAGSERLIVRWKTCGKAKTKTKKGDKGMKALYRGIGASEQVDKVTEWLGGDVNGVDDEFCGLFIFEFDEEGRILSHTIEHVEGSFEGSLGLGGKVISLTEWLLARVNGHGVKHQPALAFVEHTGTTSARGGRRGP